jgi:hypothetical protein
MVFRSLMGDGVLASGEKSWYRYELSECQQDGKATHYVITAAPKLPGVVGKYSFAQTNMVLCGMTIAAQKLTVLQNTGHGNRQVHNS